MNKELLLERIEELRYSNGCSCDNMCYPDKYSTALDDVLKIVREEV